MYKEVLFMKLKDLLLVADCNYHVFFKKSGGNSRLLVAEMKARL